MYIPAASQQAKQNTIGADGKRPYPKIAQGNIRAIFAEERNKTNLGKQFVPCSRLLQDKVRKNTDTGRCRKADEYKEESKRKRASMVDFTITSGRKTHSKAGCGRPKVG